MTERFFRFAFARLRWARACGCVLAASALVAGCGSYGPMADTATDSPSQKGQREQQAAQVSADTGSVGFSLVLDGAQIDTATYDIKRDGFDKSGSIDVSHSPGISVVVSGIPFASGYQATLTAHSGSGLSLSCTGSASFDVTTNDITPVTVPMTCKEGPTVPVPAGAATLLGLLLAVIGWLMIRSARQPGSRPLEPG